MNLPKRGSHICRRGHRMVKGKDDWWCRQCSAERKRRYCRKTCHCGNIIWQTRGRPVYTECTTCRKAHTVRPCQECGDPVSGGRMFCSTYCKERHGRVRRKLRRGAQVCIGWDGKACRRLVINGPRCGTCEAAYTRARAHEVSLESLPPGPKLCGMVQRGSVCREVLLFQVNRAGRLVTWCPIHGEAVPPVLRPGDEGYPLLNDANVGHKRGAA